MEMEETLIIALIGIFVLVVTVSGCTSNPNEKVLGVYNLSTTTTNPVIDKYVELPAGTRNLKIEYSNMTSLAGNDSYFQFTTYNIVAQKGQAPNDYAVVIDTQAISLNSTSPRTGSFTLYTNNAKSVGIRASNATGKIKIIINFKGIY
jgi:hypothetical protein